MMLRCKAGVYSFNVGDLQSATGVDGALEGAFFWDVLIVSIHPYEETVRQRDALVYSFGLGANPGRIETATPTPPTATITTTVTLTGTGTVTATGTP